ncbi:PAS domain S-box protein [Accumulibacter sp.]|uniref:PAS domain S-box protein n=1 Tax=Accumulibacter sp. TaxID=2053492 RepID=UPI0028C4AE9E|nr:PAS domain S-box protein [Accumulibacter sp.]
MRSASSPTARTLSSARPLWLWLALRFVLAGVLPLLLVAALVLSWRLPQALADIADRHQALARAISGQIEAHLLGAGRELAAVAEHLRQQGERSPSFWFAALDAHAGVGEVFSAIYIVDARDSLFAVGLPEGQRGQRRDLLNIDLSRWAVLREARARNAAVWSPVFLSALSAQLAVSLAIPVADRAVIGEVSIGRLSEFLAQLPIEAGMSTMILDRQGQVVAHSQRRPGIQQLNLGQLSIVGEGLRGRFTTQEFSWDGEPFIGTLVSVPQLGWMVLVAQPRSDVLKPFLATLSALLVGALVALLLATSATLILARGFARRLGRYTAQARALADGDYGQGWPLSNIRELDSLADDLDRMSLAIRQREQDLANSEARYRSVISNAPVVIFQFDQHGVLSLSEGKGLAGGGLGPGEAVGQSLFDIYRDYPEICQAARRAIAGEALHFTARIRGTSFETYLNPVPADDGSVQVMGVALDITERVRAEELLRQANLVVENSPAMLFRWRAEEGWPAVFASPNVSQLGYSAEELLDGSINFAALIHPDDLQRVGKEVQDHVDHGDDRFQQEYRIVTRDGTIRWVDDRTAVQRNAAGQVTHYLGVVIDTTERKQAEQALQRANRQLQMISDCKQALIRATDESELLNTVCRILVKVGDFRMAWVGFAEHDQSSALRPVAHAGQEAGYLDRLNAGRAGGRRGRGAHGTAIRTGRPCLVQNIASDPRFALWRADALARGYAALCALPLRHGERTLGALTIYSSLPDVFDADEVALLSELAGDLSFGITVLRTRIDRQAADQALRGSEAHYRLLFESNPHPMWVYDLETLAFLTINDAAVTRYGYSPDEFLNMTVLDLHPQEHTAIPLEDILAEEPWVDCAGIWRHRLKDGTIIDVELIAHPISYQGHPAALVLAEDITERKRSEQAVLQSELKYRELVENANSIILRWNPKGEITFINEFGLQFFGYAEEELLGQHVVGTIVSPGGANGRDLQPLMEDICHHPERFEHNINENMRRGGERVWVSWTNRAVTDHRGQVVEVFSVGSDITARKRAEDELQRHREHLEELVAERTAELRQAMAQLVQTEKLAALGNLVAGVAHELNTPLGNARVVASVLAEEFRKFAAAMESGRLRRSQADALLSQGREAVELLERNTARAADLLGHFKQVAVDQSSARRRSFDLRQTVDEMMVSLRLSFKHTRHRIELQIPAGLELDSYPGPLEQVIANLVGNSLLHGFDGIDEGCIQIAAHAVDPDQVVLRYSDNGVGIAAATLNRIFEPFFTTRLGQGGSGLGLYMVYNLVTAVLGGTIAVDSAAGQGASFTLTLPRTAPDRSAGGGN